MCSGNLVVVKDEIKLLDVVALTEPLPEKGLLRGQVGTVVMDHKPGIFLVEFCKEDGSTISTVTLTSSQLLKLYFKPVSQAASAAAASR